MTRSLLLILLVACGGNPEGPARDKATTPTAPVTTPTESETTGGPDDPVVEEPTYTVLDPVGRLVRASMALRGVRPTVEELDAVVADPGQVDALIRGFLDDDRFPERVAALFAEVYWTRHEHDWVRTEYYLQDYTVEDLARSVGVEPLEVIEYITRNDLPITELVTGDWTMANDVLSEIWPVDYPEGASGWQKVHYTDGRPAAGLLVSNGMWWSHGSMENNLNRNRANQISRIFLCHDYLDTEIVFDDTPLDAEATLDDAVRTDPNCAVCHDSLDPLASHMFGFFYFSYRKGDPNDIERYHPEREHEWSEYGMPPPGFKGEATSGLTELGRKLAEEPRFRSCFVDTAFKLLLRRPSEPAEGPIIDRLTGDFEDDGLKVRALFEDLALSDAFADGGDTHGSRLVDPHLLSEMTFELTGYRLADEQWDLLRGPLRGYSALAGGAYGIFRFEPLPEPATTFLLVNKRFAEGAAAHVVDRDLSGVATPRLLDLVDGTENPTDDRDLMARQLVLLHKRILSEVLTVDDPIIAADLALMERVRAESGQTRDAWVAVVALLLRDPEFVVY